MQRYQKYLHLFLPLILTFLYIYFVILLAQGPSVDKNQKIDRNVMGKEGENGESYHFGLIFVMITGFLVIFVYYGLVTYAIFHKNPGYQGYSSFKKIQKIPILPSTVPSPPSIQVSPFSPLSIPSISLLKSNSSRLAQLPSLLRQNIPSSKFHALRNEYIHLYCLPSFCSHCQLIKMPRTHHCFQCDRCVLKSEGHKWYLGGCVGRGNLRLFLQYLWGGMIGCWYGVGSLVGIGLAIDWKQGSRMSQWQAVMFVGFLGTLIGFGIFYGKEYFIAYFNAVDGLTNVQRKLDIITDAKMLLRSSNSNSNLSQNQIQNLNKKINIYQAMFPKWWSYLKIQDIADPNNWLQDSQEQQGDAQTMNQL